MNRGIQVVVKRLVVEQSADRAFAFADILHDVVQLLGELTEFLGQFGAPGGEIAHGAAGGSRQKKIL
jgi:hypothetical protein